MKILLVTSTLVIGAYDAPPLGLYRLRFYLNKQGYACDILDTSLDNVEKALRKVEQGEYQIIGFSVTHNQMEDDLYVITQFHKASQKSNQKCLFIAGGQEATYNYKQWFKGGIDVILTGYAEKSLAHLAKHFAVGYEKGINCLGLVDGVVWKDDKNDIHFNPCKPMTKIEYEYFNFESFKEWDIPFQRYWDKARAETQGLNLSKSIFIPETVRLFTATHCPSNCGYCSSHSFLSFSQQTRAPIYMLTAEQIYAMIMWYVQEKGAKGFLFSDDEFLINKQRAVYLCESIIKAKLEGSLNKNILFNCQGRVIDFLIREKGEAFVDKKFIEKLVQAGFHSIGMGIETFSDRLLQCPSMNKFGYSLYDSLHVIDVMLQIGMIPHVFIILFIPEATKDEIIFTMSTAIDMIEKGCEIVVNPILRALPGSPIFGHPDYPMAIKRIQNEISHETIEIEKEYIPRDPYLAKCASLVMEKTDLEISTFQKNNVWKYGKIPKTIVGIFMFIATAKLLGRSDLANKWLSVIHTIVRDLEKQIKQGKSKKYN